MIMAFVAMGRPEPASWLAARRVLPRWERERFRDFCFGWRQGPAGRRGGIRSIRALQSLSGDTTADGCSSPVLRRLNLAFGIRRELEPLGRVLTIVGVAILVVGAAFIAGMLAERYAFSPLVSAPVPPKLISPEQGAVLKNGSRQSGGDPLIWEFRWARLPGARQYRLIVIHSRTEVPMVDEQVQEPRYRMVMRGHRVEEPNLKGWWWRVKAEFRNGWSEWSEDKLFDVESPKD
jgi:hypothetical protein